MLWTRPRSGPGLFCPIFLAVSLSRCRELRSALGHFFSIDWFQDDAIDEWLEVHGFPPFAGRWPASRTFSALARAPSTCHERAPFFPSAPTAPTRSSSARVRSETL